MTVVSFDFDDTLAEYSSTGWDGCVLVCIPKFLQLLKEYHALGCKCIILTARTPQDEHVAEIEQFLKDHEIEHAVSDIVFTSHQPKGPFAKALDVNLHYDDSVPHLESVRSVGIQAISSI
jgi:acid phosphatase class B